MKLLGSIALIPIDFQNCFGDTPEAPLRVPGAFNDALRTRGLVLSLGERIDSIFASADLHPFDHIAHPSRWLDVDGSHPPPFIQIRYQDIRTGLWRAADPADQAWQREYVRLLEVSGRRLTIWPVHGQSDTWEQAIVPELQNAFAFWRSRTGRKVRSIQKGMNRDTEQFGIFGAEVPIYDDPTTWMQLSLIDEIASHDNQIFVGEASSHCVRESVTQYLDNRKSTAGHCIVLKDCMSPVPKAPDGTDFPAEAAAWLYSLKDRGVSVLSSFDIN